MNPGLLDLVLAPRSGQCCEHVACGGGHACLRVIGKKESELEAFMTCTKCGVVVHGWFRVKNGQVYKTG